MNYLITPPRNTEELAAFLEEMNKDMTRHVGFCGNMKEEIHGFEVLHELIHYEIKKF